MRNQYWVIDDMACLNCFEEQKLKCRYTKITILEQNTSLFVILFMEIMAFIKAKKIKYAFNLFTDTVSFDIEK